MRRFHVSGATVEVIHDDITGLDVDVVVNAANERLAHGGGVAAALARAGGPTVREESDRWVEAHGPVGRGGAAITTAGEMRSKWIVHIVGPRYAGRADDEAHLRETVTAALDAAEGLGARSIAVPAISAGVFGYPLAEAARVIANRVVEWLGTEPRDIATVILVGYDRPTAEAFSEAVAAATGA